jgi:hypothetical protein
VLQRQNDGDAMDLKISTELVVRQSCGCSALVLGRRTASQSNERFMSALMMHRERITAQLGRAARGRFSAAGDGWERSLLSALTDDLIAGTAQRFLPATERLTQRLAAARVDLNAVDEVLTVLREELAPVLQSAPDAYRLAEDLFHAVRLATSAALQRGLGRAQLELTRWARKIAGACNSLAAARDFAELGLRVRQVLPELGLSSCFVCVYDTPGDANQARLVVSTEPDATKPGTSPKAFRGRDLLPPELASMDGGGRSFAVLPLLGEDAVTGHVLLEYKAQHAFSCGVLAEALSIAVRNFHAPRASA